MTKGEQLHLNLLVSNCSVSIKASPVTSSCKMSRTCIQYRTIINIIFSVKKVWWHILLLHNLTQALINSGLYVPKKGCLCKCAAGRLVLFSSLQSITVAAPIAYHICQSTVGCYTYIFQWPLVTNNISWGKSQFHASSYSYKIIFKNTGPVHLVHSTILQVH